jgi:hypothetical protein
MIVQAYIRLLAKVKSRSLGRLQIEAYVYDHINHASRRLTM